MLRLLALLLGTAVFATATASPVGAEPKIDQPEQEQQAAEPEQEAPEPEQPTAEQEQEAPEPEQPTAEQEQEAPEPEQQAAEPEQEAPRRTTKAVCGTHEHYSTTSGMTPASQGCNSAWDPAPAPTPTPTVVQGIIVVGGAAAVAWAGGATYGPWLAAGYGLSVFMQQND